jgi:hypothetical protein
VSGSPPPGDPDDAALILGAGLINQQLSIGTNVVVAANNISVTANITDVATVGVSLLLAANTGGTGDGVITVADGVSILSTGGPFSVSMLTGSGSGSSIVLGVGSLIDTHGGSVQFGHSVVMGTASGSAGSVTINTTGAGTPGAVTFSGGVDDRTDASVGLLLNGVCVAGDPCAKTPPPPIVIPNSTVLYSNTLNSSQGGLTPPGGPGGGPPPPGPDILAVISPSGGPGSDNSAPTDTAVDALSGPLNAGPPTQAQPRAEGNYVSLMGSMLYEWREPRGAGASTTPGENTDFSGWGNEARW